MIAPLPELFQPKSMHKTIIGNDGMLELLEGKLDWVKKENGLYQLSNVIFAHWAVKEKQHVEFDVYQTNGVREVNENAKCLWKTYGLLLTPLIQSGYAISSEVNQERFDEFFRKFGPKP